MIFVDNPIQFRVDSRFGDRGLLNVRESSLVLRYLTDEGENAPLAMKAVQVFGPRATPLNVEELFVFTPGEPDGFSQTTKLTFRGEIFSSRIRTMFNSEGTQDKVQALYDAFIEGQKIELLVDYGPQPSNQQHRAVLILELGYGRDQ